VASKPKAVSPERSLRASIVAKARWMNASGLNQGTSGNLSARCGAKMLITPSAQPYDKMTPAMIAAMPFEGDYGAWEGPLRPSVEWRFHLDILRARPELGAIVHTHSPHATALSMLRKDIPACHYMIAAFGGSSVRVADYALYGTAELSAAALRALEGRSACLLANHGMIACGRDLDQAMANAVELESLARQYILAKSVGEPVILSQAEIDVTLAGFASYRPQGKK